MMIWCHMSERSKQLHGMHQKTTQLRKPPGSHSSLLINLYPQINARTLGPFPDLPPESPPNGLTLNEASLQAMVAGVVILVVAWSWWLCTRAKLMDWEFGSQPVCQVVHGARQVSACERRQGSASPWVRRHAGCQVVRSATWRPRGATLQQFGEHFLEFHGGEGSGFIPYAVTCLWFAIVKCRLQLQVGPSNSVTVWCWIWETLVSSVSL